MRGKSSRHGARLPTVSDTMTTTAVLKAPRRSREIMGTRRAQMIVAMGMPTMAMARRAISLYRRMPSASLPCEAWVSEGNTASTNERSRDENPWRKFKA